MKKTSKFKSKKYPRLKKYADGDVVESAAITEQKRQQEELNAQARQDKNAATAAKGAGAALGAYSAYQSGQAGQGTKAQKDAASYEGVIDSVAGAFTPWYATAKQASEMATSAVPQKTITNKETGEVVTDYSGTSGKQAAAVFKPQHEMAVEDLSSGNTGLAVAEMFLPGLGYESRSNALGMQKGINKLFGSEENDAAANFAKAEAANKAYDEQQKQAYAAQQAQQKAYMNQQIQSGIQNYYANPDKNQNSSQTFAMGGIPQMPNAEVEGNEMITSNTRPQTFGGGGVELASNNPYGTPTYKTNGASHANGGMPISMAPGSVINGKTINPMTGNKFTKDIDAIAKMENKFTKKAESGDKYSRTMAKLMLPTLAMKKEKLNELQKYVIANNEERKALKNGVIPSRDNEMSEPQGMHDQSQNGMVMAKYGAQMKYRMGGMQRLPMYDDGGPLLSPEGYNSINQFENTKGTYDRNTGLPAPMNAGDQYAQTGGSSNAVKEIEDYIDSSIGRDAWDKLPDNIKTQMYDAMFNSGGANKDYYMRGLAQAIYNSDPNSDKSGMTGKNQRNALDLNESFNTIKNADYSSDDIYNNFVGIRGEQLNSIGKNSKFPDAYMPTYSSRAKSIDANYINNSAANKPVTPGVPVNPSAPQTATQQPAYNNIYPRMSPSPFITKQEQDQLALEDMNRRGQANELAATGQQTQAATPTVAQTPSYNNIYPRVSSSPSPFITPRESDRLQYENDVRKVTEQGMANKGSAQQDPDPKDYSKYSDYAAAAAQLAGPITALIQNKKPALQNYVAPQASLLNSTEAMRQANIEANAARKGLKDMTGGNVGQQLGNLSSVLTRNALAKAQTQERYDNANAQIMNRNAEIAADYAFKSINKRDEDLAGYEDINTKSIGDIGKGIANINRDSKQTQYDLDYLDFIKRQNPQAYQDYLQYVKDSKKDKTKK